jgi:hypothetical protein
MLFWWVVGKTQTFRGKIVSIFRVEMETVCLSETLVSTYESTWRHSPEEHRHPHSHKNLKYHTKFLIPRMSLYSCYSLSLKCRCSHQRPLLKRSACACSSITAREQVSHSYETTGDNYCVIYVIFIFIFLDKKRKEIPSRMITYLLNGISL